MPPRTLAFDLGRRGSNYVCKSCLESVRSVPNNTPPWLARPVSNAARRAARQPPKKKTPKQPEGVPDLGTLQKMLLEDYPHPPSTSATTPLLSAPPAPGTNTDTDTGKGGELDVNYFEQDGPGGKLRRLRDKEEFAEVSTGLDAEISTAITDLEHKMLRAAEMLQRMEKTPGGHDKDRAEELRRRFKRSLRVQYKGKIGPEAKKPQVLHITGFTSRQRAVAILNAYLARDSVTTTGVPRQRDVTESWRYYSAARRTLSTNWRGVPRAVWNFLWRVLSWEGDGIENPHRLSHLYVLAKDMQAAGVPLRYSQQLVTMEAMFVEGWEKEAIEAWKKAVVTLGSKPEVFAEYWELGVRMCSQHGDIDRAERAAETLLRSAQPPNPRVLMPIIEATAAKHGMIEHAWETYTHMRTLLGETITIEDHDAVIAMFLAAGHVDHALQAFADMMLSKSHDVIGKGTLPMAIGNHFFLGKWLKRLIGAGDLEGAYKVVVYMQAHRVTPAPIQLNGLIGAWLRRGSAEDLEKADKLAWGMIRARLRFVLLRHHRRGQRLFQKAGLEPDRDAGAETDAETGYVCRTRATVETFCLLAENYCSRRLHERVKNLFDVMRQAETVPDSFLMNQLIRSYSNNREADVAAELYETMTKHQHITPDGHTFLTLFNSLSVNRLVQRDPALTHQDIPAARHFFHEMVTANWTFDSPELFVQLPRTILFSFHKTKDFRGMIVAARAMRSLFGFHPPEALLIELAAGAGSGAGTGMGMGVGSLRVRSKGNMDRLVRARRTVEMLVHQCRNALVAMTGRPHPAEDDMTEEERADEQCEVLEMLILLKAGAQDMPAEEVRPLLEEAAGEMGVWEVVFGGDRGAVERLRKIGNMVV
ncbi:uncharacterized protein C8A04DRAFT_38532 [Dichotomopilus funicola]|uniref:Pentatricopeptide repeat protein n=1 Tax=Dichotomopilus funicola TaxID=1934379 RepID=A0AAN6UZX0_9PEZI|nr:hypothetical protein C8A04DRAFT_38532 [Dichotomopilus funicola]